LLDPRQRFPVLPAGNRRSGGGGGTARSAAFAAGWTMPSSAPGGARTRSVLSVPRRRGS